LSLRPHCRQAERQTHQTLDRPTEGHGTTRKQCGATRKGRETDGAERRLNRTTGSQLEPGRDTARASRRPEHRGGKKGREEIEGEKISVMTRALETRPADDIDNKEIRQQFQEGEDALQEKASKDDKDKETRRRK